MNKEKRYTKFLENWINELQQMILDLRKEKLFIEFKKLQKKIK